MFPIKIEQILQSEKGLVVLKTSNLITKSLQKCNKIIPCYSHYAPDSMHTLSHPFMGKNENYNFLFKVFRNKNNSGAASELLILT